MKYKFGKDHIIFDKIVENLNRKDVIFERLKWSDMVNRLKIYRAKFRCENCGKMVATKWGLRGHHIKDAKMYGNDADNCIILCLECEKIFHEVGNKNE